LGLRRRLGRFERGGQRIRVGRRIRVLSHQMAEAINPRIGSKKSPRATQAPNVFCAISSPYFPEKPQAPGKPMKIKAKIDSTREAAKTIAGRLRL